MPGKRFMAECPLCGIIFNAPPPKVIRKGEESTATDDEPKNHQCERCGLPLTVEITLVPDQPENP